MPRHDTDFFSHLEEFRGRLILCLSVFGAVTVGCWFFSHSLLDFLTRPLQAYGNVQLFFQKPYEAFLTHLEVSALSGFIFSSPVFIIQLWLFIAPGLYQKEKKVLLPLILVSIALFLVGVVFAYVLVIPFGLRFLLNFQTEGLRPLLGIEPYFSFLIGMLIGFGVLFDFPVVLIGLVRLGITSTKTLTKARKIIIVLIFIAAAVLTPSPDPISQLMLAIPLWALFEISMVIARWIEKRRPI